MADAFTSALFGAEGMKATARMKLDGGRVWTVTLLNAPADDTEEEFHKTAAKGTTLAEQVKKDDERARTYRAPKVTGAAAQSATALVLGFTPAKRKADKPQIADEPTAK